MSRAIRLAAVALLAAVLLPVRPVAAPQTVNMVNGIGLIDYSREPKLEIGSWVRYHLTGSSEMGMSDDYTVTVLIAGEERFWGEDGFWVETMTEPKDGLPTTVATLMSYAIFDDSLAVPHMQLYSRKMISEIDQNGIPQQMVTKRTSGSLRTRTPVASQIQWYVDTLGIESITAPKGTYECRKISMRQGVGTTTDVGDSTVRTEVREDRIIYMSKDVPLTGIVREEIEYSIKRKTWRIGQSQGAPEKTMERSKGAAVLVAFGTGMEPQVVPAAYRRSLKDYLPAENRKRVGKSKKTG